jgi:hypothetical protein
VVVVIAEVAYDRVGGYGGDDVSAAAVSAEQGAQVRGRGGWRSWWLSQ